MRESVAVVPCFREPLYLIASTIESARGIVDRVVVVDDGMLRVDIDTLDATVIHRPTNGGPGAALNYAIRTLPDDAIVCRLDVRDLFYSAKANQIEFVRSGKVRACVSHHHDPVRGVDWIVPDDWRRRIHTDSPFSNPTIVHEVSAWREVGGYDESLRWGEDWHFSLMLLHGPGLDVFPEVTMSAGMFPGGHSDVRGEKRQRRDECIARIYEYAQALKSPDRHRHLYDPDWCARHGRVQLKRPIR